MVAKVVGLHCAGEDGHHPGDARAAGDADDVPSFLRAKNGAAERTEDRYVAIVAPVGQPVTETTAGLALQDQRYSVRFGSEVDHRIGAPTGEISGFNDDELASFERHRRRQMHVELAHVTGQSTNVADAPTSQHGPLLQRDNV